VTGEAISLSASTESLRQCRVLEIAGGVASEVTPAKSKSWVWAAPAKTFEFHPPVWQAQASSDDDLIRNQRLRKSTIDTMADADYVSALR